VNTSFYVLTQPTRLTDPVHFSVLDPSRIDPKCAIGTFNDLGFQVPFAQALFEA